MSKITKLQRETLLHYGKCWLYYHDKYCMARTAGCFEACVEISKQVDEMRVACHAIAECLGVRCLIDFGRFVVLAPGEVNVELFSYVPDKYRE